MELDEPFLDRIPVLGPYGNSTDSFQMPQYTASDKVLHSADRKFYINKTGEIFTRHIPNYKWKLPNGKEDKFIGQKGVSLVQTRIRV